MSEDEAAMLEGTAHVQATSRLSCQVRFTNRLDGLRVIMAPDG